MKKNQWKKWAWVAAITILVAGCTKNSNDANSTFSLVGNATPAPQVNGGTGGGGGGVVPSPTVIEVVGVLKPILPQNLGSCTRVSYYGYFETAAYDPKTSPVVLYTCPKSASVTFSLSNKAAGNALKAQIVAVNTKNILVRDGFWTTPGEWTVSIDVSDNGVQASTQVMVKVTNRKVTAESRYFNGLIPCQKMAPYCDAGTLFELTTGVYKCRYSEADITQFKNVSYSGNDSHLFYLPSNAYDCTSTNPQNSSCCIHGGTWTTSTSWNGNNFLPKRCVLANQIAGHYNVLSMPEHHNWYKASGQSMQNGFIRAQCPVGTMPITGSYKANQNSMSCLVWNVTSPWSGPPFWMGTKLYHPKRSSAPICPEGTTLDSNGCLIAEFSSGNWSVTIDANFNSAVVAAKSLSCQL